MLPARDAVRRRAAVTVLSTALMACNAVVGIEEPIDVGVPDAGLGVDAPPSMRADGAASSRDVASNSDVSTDAAVIADASSMRDVAAGGDGATPDRVEGTVTDGGSGASLQDGREAGGIVVAPGLATGSCTFSAISGANADDSPYSSTQGVAKRKLTETGEIIDLNLTNFVRGVQRVVNIRLRGPLTAGKTTVLDDINVVEYYDVKTGYGWGSAFATIRGGMLKIEDVNGASFSFTMANVKMAPHANMVGSLGSFTLDGYGSANPQ